MRQNDDGKTVAAMDMLVPGVIYKISLSYYNHQVVFVNKIFRTIDSLLVSYIV